jgi:hypothetical protein
MGGLLFASVYIYLCFHVPSIGYLLLPNMMLLNTLLLNTLLLNTLILNTLILNTLILNTLILNAASHYTPTTRSSNHAT